MWILSHMNMQHEYAQYLSTLSTLNYVDLILISCFDTFCAKIQLQVIARSHSHVSKNHFFKTSLVWLMYFFLLTNYLNYVEFEEDFA